MKQSINLMTGKKEAGNIRNILNEMRSGETYGEISQIKFGNIGENILINFSVDDKFLEPVIKNLIKNNINVLTFKNENLTSIVDRIKGEFSLKRKSAIPSADDLNKKDQIKKPSVSIDQLETLAQSGNYKEVLKISKDIINYNAQVIDRAKQVLIETVVNAIEKLFRQAAASKHHSENNIKEIISIVSDQNIRTLKNSHEIIIDAGLKIIELCKLHPGYVADLVDLSNNKSMHNLINIKAAVEFGRIILMDSETHRDAIDYAAKHLNTKWLYTAFDVAERELSREEIEIFEKTVAFINNKRN